ncbi:YqzH-like protein [Bacillus sp. OV194]|nr:YqzH-like protein [Bacillus sp. OV194]
MENQLLRKWLEKALLDYFYEKEAIPYAEKDYALLQERIKKELQTEEAEDPYLTVQDVVYSFITKE